MKVKRILSEVKLVIADVEVELNGTLRSSPTLCALIENVDGLPQSLVPLACCQLSALRSLVSVCYLPIKSLW